MDELQKAFDQVKALAKERDWMRSELRTIGLVYCDVDVDDPEQVEDGLTEGLIYAFLEGAFDKQSANLTASQRCE